MGQMSDKYKEIRKDVLAMPYGSALWKHIDKEIRAKAGSLQSAEQLDDFAKQVIVSKVDDSKLSDEDKIAYYGKYNTKTDHSLDFGKMLESGDLVMGQGLKPNERLKLSVKYKMTPEQFNKSLTEARKAYVANSQKGLDQQIVDQRAYYGAITSGDTKKAEAIAKSYEGNPSFQAFKEDADKEAPKWYERAGQIAAEFGVPSATNYYKNAVDTGNDVTTAGLIGRGVLDAGVNEATGGIGQGAKWALRGWAPVSKSGLIRKKIGETLINGVGGASTELGRQALAGEDIDLKAAGLTGAAQGTANSAIDVGAGYLAGLDIPGLKQIAQIAKRGNDEDMDFNWKWNAASRRDAIDKTLRNGTGESQRILARKELPSDEFADFATTERGVLALDKLLKEAGDDPNEMAKLFNKLYPQAGHITGDMLAGNPEVMKNVKNMTQDFFEKQAKSLEGKARKSLKTKQAQLEEAIETPEEELKFRWGHDFFQNPEMASRADALAPSWGYERNPNAAKRNANGTFAKKNILDKANDALKKTRQTIQDETGLMFAESPAVFDIVADRAAANMAEEEPYKLQRWADGYATLDEKQTPEYQQWKLGQLTPWTK